MRKPIGILTLLGLPLLMAACGGASSSATNNAVEGAWTGTDSWGNTFSTLVLENGNYYAMYGTTRDGNFVMQGFDHGTPTLNGNALNGAITEYDSILPPVAATLDATAVAGSSLQGAITNTSGTASGTFTATPLSAKFTGYDYNTPASASDVAGNWTVSTPNSNAEKITISPTGGVTGSINGCSFSGTVSPRSTGKNVLDMEILFGPSPCAKANQSASGIALDYDLGNGKRQLLAALQDPKKAYGYSFSAQQ